MKLTMLTIRQEALIELLEQPDPDDLPPRTHRRVIEGHEEADEIKQYLASTYAAHVRLAHAINDLGQSC